MRGYASVFYSVIDGKFYNFYDTLAIQQLNSCLVFYLSHYSTDHRKSFNYPHHIGVVNNLSFSRKLLFCVIFKYTRVTGLLIINNSFDCLVQLPTSTFVFKKKLNILYLFFSPILLTSFIQLGASISLYSLLVLPSSRKHIYIWYYKLVIFFKILWNYYYLGGNCHHLECTESITEAQPH